MPALLLANEGQRPRCRKTAPFPFLFDLFRVGRIRQPLLRLLEAIAPIVMESGIERHDGGTEVDDAQPDAVPRPRIDIYGEVGIPRAGSNVYPAIHKADQEEGNVLPKLREDRSAGDTAQTNQKSATPNSHRSGQTGRA